MATVSGLVPTAKSGADPKAPGPVPVPRRIETLLLASFATARSGFPSPLRSPIATDSGLGPTAKFVAGPKAPVPLPRRIETLLLKLFATARSGLPSLLRSPIAPEYGVSPTAKLGADPKAPVPAPRRIDTLSL